MMTRSLGGKRVSWGSNAHAESKDVGFVVSLGARWRRRLKEAAR